MMKDYRVRINYILLNFKIRAILRTRYITKYLKNGFKILEFRNVFNKIYQKIWRPEIIKISVE